MVYVWTDTRLYHEFVLHLEIDNNDIFSINLASRNIV